MTPFFKEILFTSTLERFAALLNNLIASQGLPMVQHKPKSNVAYTKKFTVRERPQNPAPMKEAPPCVGSSEEVFLEEVLREEQNPRSSDP